tara:strand:- start:23286 stop:24215 length:930 start_codon:yes stop_codon:yes gene_type:complete
MENNKFADYPFDDDRIDFLEIIKILWGKRIVIFTFTSIISIIAIIYALYLPNIYSSKAHLVPQVENSSASSALGAYSGLAGMAGISLGGDTENLSIEAMARIKSFDFFSIHFLPNIKLEDLLAVDSWDRNNNKVSYKEKIFDEASKKWVRKVRPPKSTVPSDQEAYRKYKKIISVVEDKKTKYVTLSINHQSPYVAQNWVNIIVNNLNESMRKQTLDTADQSILFLNQKYQETSVNDLKIAIAELIDSQMQKLMFASVREDYIYKTIDSPLVSELKSSPDRAFICIFGTLAGFFLAIMLVLGNHYFKNS